MNNTTTINKNLAGIHFIVILLCALMLSSCADKEVTQALSQADELMWTKPDSALAVLESVDTTALYGKYQKARYSLLYSMALDRNYVETTDVRIIMPAVKYYERHGSPDDRLKALFYFGRMQVNAGEYDKAVVTLSRALEYSDEVSDMRMLGFAYSEIAYSYSQTKNFSESRQYYSKAESFFNKAGEHRYSCMMVLDKANDCVSSLAWSEADSLLKNIVADESFPSDLKANAMATYGRMLTICPFSNCEKAVLMFERSMELSVTASFHDVVDECVYAYVLAKVGRMKESKEIFTKLDGQGFGSIPAYRYCLSQVKRLEGDYYSAYSMLLESFKDTDAQTLKMQSQSSAVAQRNYYQQFALEKKQEILHHRLWMVIIAFCSILIITCISVILYKRYVNADKERRRLVLLKKVVDNDLAESNKSADRIHKDLEILQSNYLKLYKGQCQWMSPLVEILQNSKKKTDRQNILLSDMYNKIISLLEGINSEDVKGQLDFEAELNRVYDNVIKRFRSDFKDWNESDIRLFSCIVAQFDTVLILKIFNLPSKESVYMRKVRLKDRIRHSGSTEKERYLLFF